MSASEKLDTWVRHVSHKRLKRMNLILGFPRSNNLLTNSILATTIKTEEKQPDPTQQVDTDTNLIVFSIYLPECEQQDRTVKGSRISMKAAILAWRSSPYELLHVNFFFWIRIHKGHICITTLKSRSAYEHCQCDPS